MGLCPGDTHNPGFGATIYVSMRRQWFTHVRLLIAYLTR